MNLSMRQLRAFLAVAQLGSFTRAAQQIHMTQAGLSLMLQDMETQVGSRLFHRTTRAVWLTEAGERMRPPVERALSEIEGATAAVARSTAEASRRLTVAATPLVSASIMPAVCRAFSKVEPSIDVVMKDADRSILQSMVEAGQVDVGLGILFKPTIGIQRKTLFEVPLVLVSPPGTALPSARRPLKWSALGARELIALPAGNPVQQFIDAKLALLGRADEERRTFGNLLTLIAMVEAGFGSAILPSFVRQACNRYAVEVRSLPDTGDHLSFYAITKSGHLPPAGLAVFLQTLAAHMKMRSAAAS
jgi:DNA-binding transcriptional LysR family regulator